MQAQPTRVGVVIGVVVGVVVGVGVSVGCGQLLHDEHQCEAKEERHGDQGSVQRDGRRPTACEGFDTPRGRRTDDVPVKLRLG